MTDIDSSLSVEIVEVICQNLISEYEKDITDEGLPPWYLLPLLRVCKLWYNVCERYLYQHISLGRSFPGRLRSAEKIADELLLALERNSRHATLVEGLYLRCGSQVLHFRDARLVEVCPNLQHMALSVMRMDPLECEVFAKALVDKPLVTFSISSKYILQSVSFPIYDLMQGWPGIRKIDVRVGDGDVRLVGQVDSQNPDTDICCPKLQELSFECGHLHENDFTSLRVMSNSVTNLALNTVFSDTETLDAFCGCLNTLSPNLQMLKVGLEPRTSYYHSLSEALSSLTSLKVLFISDVYLDVDAISSLPHLRRLRYSPSSRSTNSELIMFRLARLLEDTDNFAALTSISFSDGHRVRREELHNVCRRRNIYLN